MAKNNVIGKIGVIAVLLLVVLACILLESCAVKAGGSGLTMGYEQMLFNASYVHTIDISIDEQDWQSILENAKDKKYFACDVTIDGKTIPYVGVRAKGNNSLAQITKYESERYSLKIEFDHYIDGQYYYGLDKLSLNSGFQDNAYLKDFITYDMMRFMDVKAPLCSYAFVTVNGEDWGLFAAIEEVEESFALRNYGQSYGKLYKPDYKDINDVNNDVALIYTGDDPENYDNIFSRARFDIDDEDKRRLINSLKQLGTGEDLEKAVDVDQVLRYFTVQSFVVNLDSYLGRTGHNYLLYEDKGILSMIPWDYNLAYGTYMQGIDQPEDDPTKFVNYPIDTPAPGEYMLRRPMFHNLMMNRTYFAEYHALYDSFISEYFESGLFEERIAGITDMIAPFVQKDPTKFCSYEDHLLAVDTFKSFCLLRARSVRGQLAGDIPSTIRGQAENNSTLIDASAIRIQDMGDFEDMRAIRDKAV